MNPEIPEQVLKATHFTLYWAMVYCRNYTAGQDANPRVVYEMMEAIHEIPNILDRWGTWDNNIEKLRMYFGCFDHKKWNKPYDPIQAPDLVMVFNRKLDELRK